MDPCFEPHIGDFGLAREGPLQEYTRVKVVHGTMPYLPDEFLRGKKFSTKVDTYSFGVVCIFYSYKCLGVIIVRLKLYFSYCI